MFSYVDVANLALQKIGADDQLRSPDQNSTAARAIKAAWPLIRRMCLRELTPSFAKRRAELPALIETPVDYDYAFQLPAGCLRLLELLHRPAPEFHVEGGRILANHGGPLKVRYIADVEATELWDDLFVAAFAARLGYQVADRITGDRGRKADCWEEYRLAKSQAGGADAKQDPPLAHEDSSWVTARWDGYGAPPAPPGYPVAS